MLQTIEIYREDSKRPNYRAVQGQRQAQGTTPGQALDSLEEILAEKGETSASLVILQRFQPDVYFPETQQRRLQMLMSKFQDAIRQDTTLPPAERKELEQLIDAEWIAAIARGADVLAQSNHNPDA